MAYTPIPDEEIEPGKPGSSELFHKLRDNPEGIASAAPGAPKILGDAIADGNITVKQLAAVANNHTGEQVLANPSQTHIFPDGGFSGSFNSGNVGSLQMFDGTTWQTINSSLGGDSKSFFVFSKGGNTRLINGSSGATNYRYLRVIMPG